MCLAAMAFVFEYVLPSLAYTSNPTNMGAQLSEALLKLGLAVCIGGPLFFLGVSYAGALTTRIVADYMGGSAPNVHAAQRAARRDLWRVAALSFRECMMALTGLIVSALALMASAWVSTWNPSSDLPVYLSALCIVALVFGILVFPIVLALHAIAIPACVSEDLRVGAAVKRGRELLRAGPSEPSGYDTVWALLAVAGLLLVLIFGGILGSLGATGAEAWLEHLPPTMLLRPLILEMVGYLAPFLTIWTIVPVWCTTTTILYFERRIRLEGYDIESLAKDIWRADKHSRFEL